MRKFTILAMLGFVLLIGASCNKQYNENVVGSGSSGGSSSAGFNWSGTAPFSAVMNGKPFVLDPTSVILVPDAQKPGQVAFILNVADTGGVKIGLSVFGNANAGDVLSMPYPANCGVTITTPLHVLATTSGKMKILENSSTYVSGMFYVTTSTQGSGVPQTDTTITLTQGYFRVAK